MKSRAIRIFSLSVALLAVAVFAPIAGAAAPSRDQVITAAAPGADPDTTPATINGKPRYVTVTTTTNAGPSCKDQFAWLPYFVHGDQNNFDLDDACPSGDLLANTSDGSWINVRWEGKEADRQRGLWAPSIFFHDGEFYLHYAGVVKGSEQRCIWAVHAPTLGELKSATRRLFACPDDRADLAIDPDMFEHRGRLFVTYRDDGGAIAPTESAIYVTEVDGHGVPKGPKQVLLRSGDVPWTHYPVVPGIADQVVENPSIVFVDATKEWLLFYSGNGYTYSTYATGIASCGTVLMSGPRCKPISGTRRAYIGFGGAAPAGANRPRFKMPGNFHGSAGVAVFKTHFGGYAAVWHAWDDGAPMVPGSFGPAPVPGLEDTKRSLHASSLILPTAKKPGLVRFLPGPIAARKCRGEFATVDFSYGQSPTEGNDVIVGTAQADVIDGLGGDDLICGWGGSDEIAGGTGDDIIFGGRGADQIIGNGGDDVIYGGAGHDQMDGGFGFDVCRGSQGRDFYARCAKALSASQLERTPFNESRAAEADALSESPEIDDTTVDGLEIDSEEAGDVAEGGAVGDQVAEALDVDDQAGQAEVMPVEE